MIRWKFTSVCMTVTLLLTSSSKMAIAAGRFEVSAENVSCFDYVEITLTLDQPTRGNPFTDAAMTGVLTTPGGDPLRVDGFCDSDDGRVFRIRFMPISPGRHKFTVSFRNGADAMEYVGQFEATARRRPGMIERDPSHPTHFQWSATGDHFFYNSTTAYWLLGFKDDETIRHSIDRLHRLGVNRIRVALSGRTTSGMRWKEPMIVSNESFEFRLEPWPAARPSDIENPGYDVTRFNLEHFRKAERMLAHANLCDLQVSLIFALDVADRGVDPFGRELMGGIDEQRYYRYCVARFGAFANVWWDLINEWHLCRDEAWVEKMGSLVDEWDVYGHLTSVHGKEKFPFGQSKWVDYVMFQSWDEQGTYDFLLRAKQAQLDAGRPLPVVNEEYGYEDHYPFPWGGKRIWPARIAETRVRLAWEMTMAGGYQTTGERANVEGMGGWINGRGNDEMLVLPGYLRLRRFFEGIEWWTLEPRPDLVTGESRALPVNENGAPPAPALCLAKPGDCYVVYLRQGGTASLELAEGDYRVTRYNPRDGDSTPIGSVRGGATWTSPGVSDTENWVWLLQRR